MSAALLAKLKVKKPPQVQEDVAVVMPEPAEREEVVIKARIVDKTKVGAFDREAFLNEIAPAKVTKQLVKGPPQVVPDQVTAIPKPSGWNFPEPGNRKQSTNPSSGSAAE